MKKYIIKITEGKKVKYAIAHDKQGDDINSARIFKTLEVAKKSFEKELRRLQKANGGLVELLEVEC